MIASTINVTAMFRIRPKDQLVKLRKNCIWSQSSQATSQSKFKSLGGVGSLKPRMLIALLSKCSSCSSRTKKQTSTLKTAMSTTRWQIKLCSIISWLEGRTNGWIPKSMAKTVTRKDSWLNPTMACLRSIRKTNGCNLTSSKSPRDERDQYIIWPRMKQFQ